MTGMIEEASMVFNSLSGLSSIVILLHTLFEILYKSNYSTTGTHLKNYLRKSFHYSGAVLWTSNFKASGILGDIYIITITSRRLSFFKVCIAWPGQANNFFF